jgi:hypothetical protein
MARNTILTSRTVFASLLAIGVAGGAQAQGVGNIVGGGVATLMGGGDDQQITYSPGGAGGGAIFAQAGRTATFAGSHGGKPVWTYAAPPDGNPGREAWMIGGGDDTQVVYVSPHQRR